MGYTASGDFLKGALEMRILLACLACSIFVGTISCGSDRIYPAGPEVPPLGHGLGAMELLHEYNNNFDDSSANGNHGTPFGSPSFVTGCLDGAVSFDGTADYISVAGPSNLQPPVVSVEVYFRPRTLLTNGSTFVPIVVKLNPYLSFGSRVDGYDIAYQDPFGTGGRIGFGIGGGGGTLRYHASKHIDITPDQFHHVVGTYDLNEIRLYLDGTLVASTPHTAPIAYLNGPLNIGGKVKHHLLFPSGQHQFFDGEIDEVTIYSRVLSEGEIQARAARCTTIPTLELLHEYNNNFDDSSANGNHGTPFGSPSFVTGCLDGAVSFDGTADYISVAGPSNLQPPVVSVEVYFRPRTLLTNGSTFVPIVVKLNPYLSFGSRVDGYDIAYQDPFGTGGRIGFGIGGGGGTLRYHASKHIDITPDQFHHVVGTYDLNEIRLYLDGTLVASTPHTAPIAYLNGPLNIGGKVKHHLLFPSGQHQFFDGEIDEVTIYSRVLSEGEIQARAARCTTIPITIGMDINPHACPNRLKVNGGGPFSVALLGTGELDVEDIDVESVRLEGVAAVHDKTRDVGPVDYDPCGCVTGGRDGIQDLVLRFNRQEILSAIAPVVCGESLSLSISGTLLDGTPFQGSDCIIFFVGGSGGSHNSTAGGS